MPETLQKGLASRTDTPGPSSAGKSWFLGIAINRYDHFPHLNNAVKDVRDIAALLEALYDIEPDRVFTLFDEAATRENIISVLDQMIEKVGPNDKVLIYYSGHGHLNRKTGKGFWIPYDAQPENTAQYILNSTIKDYLEDIDALHTLLISDSCFSGSLFYKGEKRAAATAVEEMERRKSRWAFCSGRHDEEVYDGEPGTNSPFAAAILYTLKANRLPGLNVSKMIEEVVEMTRANYEQLPEGNPLFGLGHKGGQYVFRMKGTAPPAAAEESGPVHSSPGLNLRKTIAQLGDDRKEVFRWLRNWALYQAGATALLAGLGLVFTNELAGRIILALIPVLYYLAPYFPAAFSRLKRPQLLTLTAAAAAIYYALLLVWTINSSGVYPWWQFWLMLAAGAPLYYWIIPIIKRNK